ncbi:hypothetical protein GRJ2_000818100 [Grus japonensis]|uniref:Reverse transcriptase domain-containing protein n=1 Tax=Grus japonensis TaxID=30415 RepID=A0ABC9WDD6_GRUJA
MMEFRILHGRSRAISRITTLGFRRANFGLFKDLLGRIPRVRALEGREVQESWSVFKHHFLLAQDQCILKSKKPSKGGRRPAWISKELLEKLKGKKEVSSMWKKGLATWEEYRNVVRVCRDATRKAKAHLELNLARDVKDKKKGFFKYISSKRKTWENGDMLLNEVGALVTEDTEKVELLNAFLASVLPAKAVPQESQTLEGKKEDPGNYRPDSLTSIPGKVIEQLILGVISKHMESGQHGFTKGKSCLTNLIALCNGMTGWVDEERAVDVVYLDFSKAFNTLSHNIPTGKLRKCGLDEWSVRWVENWLNGRAQSIVISSAKCSRRPVMF